MPTSHLIISGKVQGVFYRASAKQMAETLSVTGWIKNTWDGNVEAVVSGDKEALEKFIAWCKKGPARAEVSEVIVTPEEDKSFPDFSVGR